MKVVSNLFFFSLLLLSITSFAADTNRYTDEVYNTVEVSTYEYADSLQLDFYSAKDTKEKNRPLIIVMHGGGFQGGERTSSAEVKFCMEMARRGFATASISYRLTRAGMGFDCKTAYEDKIETFREASIDLLRATNFLIKKSKQLKFDKTKIILLGSSAGAETILNTVFMQNSDMLRGIDYGHAKFAGVISLAGAVVSLDQIAENAVPTILVHGEKDNLVPYGKAPHHFCSPDTPGYIVLYGAEPIKESLCKMNMSYLLLHDPEGNHVWSGLGYAYSQDIANFIKQVIIDKEKVQTIKTVSQ